MPAFKNFSIWRGRLPHWRADDVQYYVSFRHRRPLDLQERLELFRALLRPEGRRWDLLILSVLPEETDIIVRVRDAPGGRPYELAEVLEKAKTRTGKLIVKRTGERFSPFYGESFDRIIRDEIELTERWQAILDAGLIQLEIDGSEDLGTLWAASAPDSS